MQIDRLLDGINLAPVHTLLTFIGAILCVYVMRLTSWLDEDRDDPWLVRQGNQVALVLLALTLLWSLNYSMSTGWQPWPPHLVMVAVIDLFLGIRAYTIHISRRHSLPDGRRSPPSWSARSVAEKQRARR